MTEDTRNVIDKYKHMPHELIVDDLDSHGIALEIAIENTQRDFSMGTIVRNANAFGVRHVHIVGSKQWNKRGAMMTDKYLNLHYYKTVNEFQQAMVRRKRQIVIIDNIEGSIAMTEAKLPSSAVLVFGAEGPGISPEMSLIGEQIVAIEQFGSTRSVNVGVASGIAMYRWLQEHSLQTVATSP